MAEAGQQVKIYNVTLTYNDSLTMNGFQIGAHYGGLALGWIERLQTNEARALLGLPHCICKDCQEMVLFNLMLFILLGHEQCRIDF